jgi:hypothetical protein
VERVFGDALRFIIYNKCSRKGQRAGAPNRSVEGRFAPQNKSASRLLMLEASA